MSNNPLTPQELLTFFQASAQQGYTTPQLPPKYVFATDAVNFGAPAFRLFDAAYISTGIIDPNRLGTGATGAGNLYLADDGTWKVISGAPGVGDMLKATYDVDNDGTVDSAERIEIIVRNSTGTTLTKGTVVYLSGATGNRPNALRSQANSEATSSKTIGIVVADITNNSDGYVAVNGTLHDLDTSAYADGAALWLSPTVAGGYTTTVPSEPNHSVFIGYVARSHPTQGRLVILIQNGYELNELHDVYAPSPTNGDLLQWDSANAYWKNVPVATVVPTPTLAQVTTAGNTTTNAITVGGVKSTADYELRADNGSANVRLGRFKFIRSAYDPTGVAASIDFWRGPGGNEGVLAFSTNPGIAGDNAAERMRITAGGNVLIGTAAEAGYKLDVAGTARVTNGIYFSNSSGSFLWELGAYALRFGTNSTERMRIDSAGNVGIGTLSPTSKLHVAGGRIEIDNGFNLESRTTNGNALVNLVGMATNAINVGIWEGNYMADLFLKGGNGAIFADFSQGNSKYFAVRGVASVTPTEYMRVTSTGNVGIGTSAPTYRLDVRGTAATHTVSSDIGYNINGVAKPTTGSLALVVSAGNVNLGLHYYFVTFTTVLGETNPFQIGSITTVSGSQQVTVTIPTSTDPRVTGRKLYRTKAGGNYWETFLLATIAENTSTVYTDNIADASLTGTSGVGFYQVNTTHRAISINGTQSLVADEYATYLGVGAGLGVTSAGGNNTFIGFNAGRWAASANQSVGIGNNALSALTSGGNNIGIGSQAGSITIGSDNILIGRNSGASINTGNQNTIIGSFTWNLGTVTGKLGNTGLGYRVGSNNTGNYNLFLGYDAGYYVTGSNQILLDTVSRADEATAKSSALIYGVTSATAANQTLSLGGGGNVMIGTITNAGYKLDVVGDIRVNSTLHLATVAAYQGMIGFNRNTLTGAILNSSYGAYQFHNNNGVFAIENYSSGGIQQSKHTMFNNGNLVLSGGSAPTDLGFKLDTYGSAKVRGATYFGQVSQPSAPTLGTNSTIGGTLPADTYTYRISALDFWGIETTPSNTLIVTTTGSTSSVSMSWPLVQGAYFYRIYRLNSGGTLVYFTNVGTNSTLFTDTGAAGTVGVTAAVNHSSYGYFNNNGDLRTGNITIVNNGVGNTSSIFFDKSTDNPAINVTEYANDSTMFEFMLRDNPDGTNDFFHWVLPDWQNSSSGWKPLKFSNFVTQIVGQSSNFWSSFSLPSSTPYYTTNPESTANSSIKWDPYTSTSYNLPKDNGTGTGVFNVDVTGFTGTNNTIYWVTIQAGATTFNWGNGWSGNAPVGTGVTITGGWQTLANGVQVRITGAVAANDRWAFRVFPVPRMGIGTTTPIAPLQVSTTIAASSGTARGVYFNPTVVATANNDTLVGLDITPTFTNGAFTGVQNTGLRVTSSAFEVAQFRRTGSGSARITVTNEGGNLSTIMDANSTTGAAFGSATATDVTFVTAQTGRLKVYHSTGNVVIQNGGTFTDAGYRLDVNGTFRAQGSITATLANTVTSSMVYYNSSTGLLTYGAVPTPTTFQIDYDYNIVGLKNGSNVVFTSSANFVLTTTRVYLNGVRLTRGVGYDYVETGTNQITLANAPNPTDQLIIEYQL